MFGSSGQSFDLNQLPTEQLTQRTKWDTVVSATNNEQLNRRIDSMMKSDEFLPHSNNFCLERVRCVLEIRLRDTAAARFQMAREMTKKFFIQEFDKDFDLAVAAETTAHIEGNRLRLACLNHVLREHGHFFFQTSAAQ